MGWIRKIRICLISSVAVALIVLAVAFTLLRTLLPYATGYIAEIEQGISEQIGLPVSIGTLDADMYWFAPRLKLLDLVIYKEDGKEQLFTLSEANFSLAYLESLRFMMPMVGDISLHGAELFIERHDNGKWVIQGFEVYEKQSSKDSQALTDLLLNANIALIDSRVHWVDFTGRSRNMNFEGASVLLENYHGKQYFEIDVGLPPDLGERLRVVAELDGDLRKFESLEAKFHFSGTGLVFENWVSTTRIKEFVHGSGKLDTNFWVHINNANVTRFSAGIKATDLVLANINHRNKTWSADRLETKVFWRTLNQGWRLDVRDLILQKDGSLWNEVADIVVANDETDWRILASYLKPVDILPLLHVLPEAVDVSAFSDYLGYVPEGEFVNFEAVFSEDEIPDLQLSSGFTNLGLNIADRGIVIKGLDGELAIDSNKSELQLDSSDVIVKAGDLFRWPLQLDTISGKVAFEFEDGVFKLDTPALHVKNQHIETVTRAFAEISADNRVFLDIQGNAVNGIGKDAYRYLPTSIMSDSLVHWLDSAIVGGYVPSGSFVFRGFANEYPFDDSQGVLQILFDVAEGRLHFLDGWPDVQNASATVRFHNASLFIENGRSHEESGAAALIYASIPDLRDAMLRVSGNVTAPADELQQYIWNSGLDRTLGRTVEQFQASGQAEIRLELDVPLGKDRRAMEELQVRGDIIFSDNELFFPITDYLLTDINGKMSFTTTCLLGEDIRGKFYGQPVKLAVRQSEDETNPETLFHISGNWEVASLLRRFDWSYPSILDGSSHWDVVMHVPHKSTDYNVMFEATSTLEGVNIGVSNIIHKPAGQRVPVSINLKMLGDVRRLNVTSTDRLDLTATFDDDNNWQFDVSSPVITGKGELNANFDVDTTGKFDLEFLNLSAFMTGDGATARKWKLKASSIPSLRLKTKTLVWHDWSLSNVGFETDHHPRGMVINNISINDPYLQVSGKGSWLRRSWRLDEETTLSFKLSSENMGDALQHLGYSRYVDKSKAKAELNWQWPGAPYRFSWGSLTGNTSVEFENGIVSNIDPGAGGRFLGLFNLLHLPRRLSLDFADVYKKGFVFDSINGTYVFGGGDAVTQDTEITASAADLTMMGRIGVEDQDYDLIAIVRPHSSVATLAGGTLIAGPTIGVGLMLLQEIFEIDLIGKDIHTIKGSWSDPVVKSMSSDSDKEGPEDLFDDFE
jgi:uncharacterized protein (TIGR02099 family)